MLPTLCLVTNSCEPIITEYVAHTLKSYIFLLVQLLVMFFRDAEEQEKEEAAKTEITKDAEVKQEVIQETWDATVADATEETAGAQTIAGAAAAAAAPAPGAADFAVSIVFFRWGEPYGV